MPAMSGTRAGAATPLLEVMQLERHTEYTAQRRDSAMTVKTICQNLPVRLQSLVDGDGSDSSSQTEVVEECGETGAETVTEKMQTK